MKAKTLVILAVSLLYFPSFPSAQQNVTQRQPANNMAGANAGRNNSDTPRVPTAVDILRQSAPGFLPGNASNCAAWASAPGIQEAEALLPLTVSGIDGTMDSIQNAILNGGFVLSGNIVGATALSITAQGTDGATFTGRINPSTSHYVIVVPADTLTVTVCFAPAQGAIATFNEQVVVGGDTVHDVTIASVPTHLLSGSLFGLNPALPFAQVSVASSDGSSGASGFVIPFSGQYQMTVPDNTYNAFVTQISPMPTQSETSALGSVTVQGADVVFNGTVPDSSTLSGQITTADGSPIPAGSLVLALDATVTPPVGCAAAGPASGFAGIDPASGSYQMNLPRDHIYTVVVAFLIQLGEPSETSTVLYQDPSTLPLTMDMMLNETFPALPGTVQFSGLNTDPGGMGVASTQVTAVTNMVTGAPNVFFSGSIAADTNGMYALVALNGTNYNLRFGPPQPAP